MAKSRDHRIDTVSGRKALKPRREPYWRKVGTGQSLGARKTQNGTCTWIAKRYDPTTRKRLLKSLGDDQTKVPEFKNQPMDFDQATKAAAAWFAELDTNTREGATIGYTLQDAINDYVEYVRVNKGDKAANLVPGRLTNHLSQKLKAKPITELTTREINTWLNAQVRTDKDFDDQPKLDNGAKADKIRASKDTANRRLAVLKACLNLAFRNGIVANDTAWRRVKAFQKTSASRTLFLTEKQVAALLSHSKDGVHNVIKAGVLTGARRGELFALTVRDFDPKEGTLRVAMGKTGARDVYLSDTAIAFFKQIQCDHGI